MQKKRCSYISFSRLKLLEISRYGSHRCKIVDTHSKYTLNCAAWRPYPRTSREASTYWIPPTPGVTPFDCNSLQLKLHSGLQYLREFHSSSLNSINTMAELKNASEKAAVALVGGWVANPASNWKPQWLTLHRARTSDDKTPRILSLPVELKLAILEACAETSVHAAVSLASTCRVLHNLYSANEEIILHPVLSTRYGSTWESRGKFRNLVAVVMFLVHSHALAMESLRTSPIADPERRFCSEEKCRILLGDESATSGLHRFVHEIPTFFTLKRDLPQLDQLIKMIDEDILNEWAYDEQARVADEACSNLPLTALKKIYRFVSMLKVYFRGLIKQPGKPTLSTHCSRFLNSILYYRKPDSTIESVDIGITAKVRKTGVILLLRGHLRRHKL